MKKLITSLCLTFSLVFSTQAANADFATLFPYTNSYAMVWNYTNGDHAFLWVDDQRDGDVYVQFIDFYGNPLIAYWCDYWYSSGGYYYYKAYYTSDGVNYYYYGTIKWRF